MSSGSVTDIALIILRFFYAVEAVRKVKNGGPRVQGKGDGWGTRGTGTGINEIRWEHGDTKVL